MFLNQVSRNLTVQHYTTRSAHNSHGTAQLILNLILGIIGSAQPRDQGGNGGNSDGFLPQSDLDGNESLKSDAGKIIFSVGDSVPSFGEMHEEQEEENALNG